MKFEDECLYHLLLSLSQCFSCTLDDVDHSVAPNRHRRPPLTVKHQNLIIPSLVSCSWNLSDWSRCILWRGFVRTRSVSCQLVPGVNSEGGGVGGGGGAGGGGEMLNGTVDEFSSLCTVGDKPESLQPCDGPSVMWFTGPWSEVGCRGESRERLKATPQTLNRKFNSKRH